MSHDPHSIADQQDGAEDDLDNPLRASALRMPAAKPGRRKSGPSGKHAQGTQRRKLSAREETYVLWDLAAKHAQTNWADWARVVLTRAAATELGVDAEQALDEAEL